MWKNGSTAMMRSSLATWCPATVWTRLATRFRCVSITPLGNPVVPLEYGSTARSRAGSNAGFAAGASLSSSALDGVAPPLPRPAPSTKTSPTSACTAAGAARARNGATVVGMRAPKDHGSRSGDSEQEEQQRERAERAADRVEPVPAREQHFGLGPIRVRAQREQAVVGRPDDDERKRRDEEQQASGHEKPYPATREPGDHRADKPQHRERGLHHRGAFVARGPLGERNARPAGHARRVLDDVDVDRGAGEDRTAERGEEFHELHRGGVDPAWVMSHRIGAAGAECVSAPIEISAAPASA